MRMAISARPGRRGGWGRAHPAPPTSSTILRAASGALVPGTIPASARMRRPLLLVGAGHPDHQGQGDAQLVAGLDDAPSHLVAAGDAAEDVDEDAADVGIAQDHGQRAPHLLRAGAAADVQEVVGPPSLLLDEVQGVHDEPGSVADAADAAAGEVDVGEPAPLGLRLEGVLTGAAVLALEVEGQLGGQLPVTVLGVLVHLQLAVGGDQTAIGGERQGLISQVTASRSTASRWSVWARGTRAEARRPASRSARARGPAPRRPAGAPHTAAARRRGRARAWRCAPGRWRPPPRSPSRRRRRGSVRAGGDRDRG
jgi:hypothetical protein